MINQNGCAEYVDFTIDINSRVTTRAIRLGFLFYFIRARVGLPSGEIWRNDECAFDHVKTLLWSKKWPSTLRRKPTRHFSRESTISCRWKTLRRMIYSLHVGNTEGNGTCTSRTTERTANVLRHIFYDRFARGYYWLYSAVSRLSCKLINSLHTLGFLSRIIFISNILRKNTLIY